MLYHDSRVLESWDHTALVASTIYNLNVSVVCLGGAKARSRSLEHFHPYRSIERKGLTITPDNFNMLKEVFGGVKGKR